MMQRTVHCTITFRCILIYGQRRRIMKTNNKTVWCRNYPKKTHNNNNQKNEKVKTEKEEEEKQEESSGFWTNKRLNVKQNDVQI